MFLIFDIDGTLADISHREGLAKEEKWGQFFSPYMVRQDTPIEEAQEAFSKAIESNLVDGYVFITGRPERLRKTTKSWLAKHFNIDIYDKQLYMRPDGNHDPSSELKLVLVDKMFSDWDVAEDDILIMIDDESDNIEAFEDEFENAIGVAANDIDDLEEIMKEIEDQLAGGEETLYNE